MWKGFVKTRKNDFAAFKSATQIASKTTCQGGRISGICYAPRPVDLIYLNLRTKENLKSCIDR